LVIAQYKRYQDISICLSFIGQYFGKKRSNIKIVTFL